MQYTNKLGLKKPDLNDYVNVSDLNENMDVLDEAVGSLQDGTYELPDLQTNDKKLAGAINEVNTKVTEHLADTAAHGIGDKSILLTTNKNTIVEAINELFTFANDGKNSIAAVIGSPATNGDTFATLANHITNHKTSLANSLGSGSGSDSLQTLVNTRLQGLKNTLAINLTNKGQSSSGTETLLNLINKVANINTGKRWASGTATSSSGTVSFEHPNGTTRNMYYVTVTGLPFNPSTVILYHSSSHPGFSILFPASLNTLNSSGRIITSWYNDLSFHGTNIYTFKLSSSAHNNSGFLLPIGDGTNVSSKPTNWLAIE